MDSAHVDKVDQRTVEHLVRDFSAGWRAPHAHAWDDLLAPDVELTQPFLPNRRGRSALADEYGRLLELLPDMRGEVRSWTEERSPAGPRVVVEMDLVARTGRRELRLPVTDTLTLDDEGRIGSRRARFPVRTAVSALAGAPSLWPRWWRSGVPPLTARRALTDRWHRTGSTGVDLHDALALGRLALAVAAWLAPSRSARLVGLDPGEPAQRYLLRVFAGRAAALGLGSLSTTGAARRRWHELGLLVDASDTAAGVDRRLSPRARGLSLALTGSYAVLGLIALRTGRSESRHPTR